MKRKRFTDQEKIELLKSTAIIKIENSNVTYCPQFKLKALKEYEKGKYPSQIFIEAGINLNILGQKNAKRSLQRWRVIASQEGEKGILCKSKGRPKSLSPEEEIKQLKAQNALLKAENEFLKKLKSLERGLI